ncbi:Hypp3272 [Branchiostoma lanceolatum]|uniref:Hypp3272 protein n=1 Tax=Branchiostoma lanceolatum TaxID=7740 RepID=A0A8J9ZYL4_BRALA|nr:Hypp3272 [Branchiostoma lanceolatum]
MSVTSVNSSTEAPPTSSEQHRTSVPPAILILCLVVLGICILSIGISRAVQYLVNHYDVFLPPDMENVEDEQRVRDDPVRDDPAERNAGIKPWRMLNSYLSTNNRVGIQITPETPVRRNSSDSRRNTFNTEDTCQCTDTNDAISSGGAVANGDTTDVQTMHQFYMQEGRDRKEAWGPREVAV